MKSWNNTYRKRAMRDAEKRQKMNGQFATADNLRKVRRLDRRIEGV